MKHGGDIYRNRIVLDFSINVNPLGILDGVKQALVYGMEYANTYPDPLCEELRGKIARHFDIDPERIICGNGASELISAICRYLRPKKALLTAPGFSGYERALLPTGAEICRWLTKEQENFCLTEEYLKAMEEERPDLIFLTNPGNPAGGAISEELLQKVLDTAQEIGTAVVADECFLELSSKTEESLIFKEAKKNLYILRAFTKSFAIPGIRLGYLVCPDADRAEHVEKELPEWNVSVPAQMAGIAALDCGGYLFETRKYLKEERPKMKKKLEELGFKVYPGEANYLLFYYDGEKDLKTELLKQKILIRDCSDYEGLSKGYYRVAVKQPEDNLVLIEAFRKILQKKGKNHAD